MSTATATLLLAVLALLVIGGGITVVIRVASSALHQIRGGAR